MAVALDVRVHLDTGVEERERPLRPVPERDVPESLLEAAVAPSALAEPGVVGHEVAGDRMERPARRALRDGQALSPAAVGENEVRGNRNHNEGNEEDERDDPREET